MHFKQKFSFHSPSYLSSRVLCLARTSNWDEFSIMRREWRLAHMQIDRLSHLRGKRHMNKIQLFICHTSKGKLKVKKFHAHDYCMALHFLSHPQPTIQALLASRVWIGIEAFNFRYAFDDENVEWKAENEKNFQHRNWQKLFHVHVTLEYFSRREFKISYTIQLKSVLLFVVCLQPYKGNFQIWANMLRINFRERHFNNTKAAFVNDWQCKHLYPLS
jgi:hypothetical protein